MIDLRKASVRQGRTFKLPIKHRAVQNINQHQVTRDWVAVQADGHDTVVSVFTEKGLAPYAVMRLKGAGHSSMTGLLPGTALTIVLDWEGALVEVPIRAGEFAFSSTYRKYAAGKDAGYVLVSIDHRSGTAVFRQKHGTGDKSTETLTVWSLDANGRPVKQIGQVKGVDAEQPIYQGHWGDRQHVVRPAGYGHKQNKREIQVYNVSTGKLAYKVDPRVLSEKWLVQEPEGFGRDADGRVYLGLTLRAADDVRVWTIVYFDEKEVAPVAAPTIYPPANKATQWLPQFGGITMPKLEKVVLHTTESSSWPSYPNFAPQFTYNPWTRQWRQHLPVNVSASTLADSSSTAVRENRDGVVQVEIVGYCDDKKSESMYHVTKMTAPALKDIADFIVWLHEKHGVSTNFIDQWEPYPASYGNGRGQRLSGPEYDAFKGVLGHQHVPSNDHGDPGVLDVKTIERYVKAALAPTPTKPDVKPTPTAPTKGHPFMGTAADYHSQSTTDQKLAAGKRELKIKNPVVKDGKTSNFYSIAKNSDAVDVVASVTVAGLKPGAYGTLAFKVFDNSLTSAADKPVDTYDGVTVAARTDGKPVTVQVVFKGDVKGAAKGFDRLLRLEWDGPAVTIDRTEITGWVL